MRLLLELGEVDLHPLRRLHWSRVRPATAIASLISASVAPSCSAVAAGRADLTIRLAEHYVEFRTAHYLSAASRRRCDCANIYIRWRRYFDNIFLLFYEDIVQAPYSVIKEVCTFLGLSWRPGAALHRPVNPSLAGDLPDQDRAFLLDLDQPVYDQVEVTFGDRVLSWRKRQRELLA